MTLVERLRTEAEYEGNREPVNQLLTEAADFIERIDYQGIHTCHAGCGRLPCVQRREIESLQRECDALRSVLSEWDQDKSCFIQWNRANEIRDQREGGK